MMKLRLQVLQASLRKVAAMLHTQQVRPLPCTTHPLPHILTALKHLASARHIGKVVVATPPALPVEAAADQQQAPAWVVTGGLGALGVLTGEWLVGQSAKRVVLLGRTGRWGELAGPAWEHDERRDGRGGQ